MPAPVKRSGSTSSHRWVWFVGAAVVALAAVFVIRRRSSGGLVDTGTPGPAPTATGPTADSAAQQPSGGGGQGLPAGLDPTTGNQRLAPGNLQGGPDQPPSRIGPAPAPTPTPVPTIRPAQPPVRV